MTLVNFSEIFCMLPRAVSRSFSDGVAMRYVLPVSRKTSCMFNHNGSYGTDDTISFLLEVVTKNVQ